MGDVLHLLQQNSPAEQIRQVFEHWRVSMKHERARLDAKRSRTVRAMLEAGYTVDDLKLAIDGCAASEWHRGRNDRGTAYDGLGLICRDAEHVDRFMELGERAHRRAQRQFEAPQRPPTAPKRAMPADVRARLGQYLPKKNDDGTRR